MLKYSTQYSYWSTCPKPQGRRVGGGGATSKRVFKTVSTLFISILPHTEFRLNFSAFIYGTVS